MRLPLIKHTLEFIEHNDDDYVEEALSLLEYMTDAKGIKDEELDVIGELISNFSGAMEVYQDIQSGTGKKEALNNFMKRVMGSID